MDKPLRAYARWTDLEPFNYISGLTGLERLKQICRMENRPRRREKKDRSGRTVYDENGRPVFQQLVPQCQKCNDNGYICVIKRTADKAYQDVDDGYYLSYKRCECMKQFAKGGK